MSHMDQIIARLDDQTDRLKELHERLNKHCDEEHEDFKKVREQVDDLTAWMRGSHIAAKFIGWGSAVIAGIAGVFVWIKTNFNVSIRP